MKKRITILFLLLASVVMFMPTESNAAPDKTEMSTLSPAGNVVQYRYRRRYRRVYYRRYYRPRYRYRRYRRVRRTRYHYYYRRGRLYRVRY